MPGRTLSRRAVLRAAGVAVALPHLPSLSQASDDRPTAPRRLLVISNNLGVLPKHFFPATAGSDYELSPYLRELSSFRQQFTVLSGLSHPAVDGGHSTENCFLTAARNPTKSGFRNQISLDQFAAERLPQETRFRTLNLGVNIDKANRSLSWTRDGQLLPVEDSPTLLFHRLFHQSPANEQARQLRRLDERQSILDLLLDEARTIQGQLGRDDRSRLDEYLTSVREVEERLRVSRLWETRERPRTSEAAPEDVRDPKRFFDKLALMLDLARLAFESDSTRIVTLMVDAFATPVFQLKPGAETSDGYHNLSHHGQDPAKLKQLEDADRRQMQLLGRLMEQLAQRRDRDQSLLDRTLILFGSNMGDANTHDNTNLPLLLAGGGLRHGRHLAYSREFNRPLSNLFVTMLQWLGVETDRFGSSDGELSELTLPPEFP